ncbi:MAG: AzlD domain-containing protein [Bacteroidales bacterium]
MSEKILLVVGMAAVTYGPRMLPLVFLPGIRLSPFLEIFLKFVPVTVLTALIVPGIFNSTGQPLTAVIGAGVAFILAFKDQNLILVVLGAIFSVFLSGLIL